MQELVLGAVIFHQSTVITLWLLPFIWKLYPASDSCVRAMEGAKQSCSTADDQTACVQNTVTTLNECNKHLPFSAGTSNETLCSSMNTVEKNLNNGLLTGCQPIQNSLSRDRDCSWYGWLICASAIYSSHVACSLPCIGFIPCIKSCVKIHVSIYCLNCVCSIIQC